MTKLFLNVDPPKKVIEEIGEDSPIVNTSTNFSYSNEILSPIKTGPRTDVSFESPLRTVDVSSLSTAFSFCEPDNCGLISIDNIDWARLFEKENCETVRTTLATFDDDNDGQLSFLEFHAALTSLQESVVDDNNTNTTNNNELDISFQKINQLNKSTSNHFPLLELGKKENEEADLLRKENTCLLERLFALEKSYHKQIQAKNSKLEFLRQKELELLDKQKVCDDREQHFQNQLLAESSLLQEIFKKLKNNVFIPKSQKTIFSTLDSSEKIKAYLFERAVAIHSLHDFLIPTQNQNQNQNAQENSKDEKNSHHEREVQELKEKIECLQTQAKMRKVFPVLKTFNLHGNSNEGEKFPTPSPQDEQFQGLENKLLQAQAKIRILEEEIETNTTRLLAREKKYKQLKKQYIELKTQNEKDAVPQVEKKEELVKEKEDTSKDTSEDTSEYKKEKESDVCPHDEDKNENENENEDEDEKQEQEIEEKNDKKEINEENEEIESDIDLETDEDSDVLELEQTSKELEKKLNQFQQSKEFEKKAKLKKLESSSKSGQICKGIFLSVIIFSLLFIVFFYLSTHGIQAYIDLIYRVKDEL